ncbi:hypothetical protein D3C87_1570320 [compost metagenome]
MTGLKTLSSKLPWLAAKPIAASLPMTWATTMVMASDWVGLTLPGMIEEPGSFSGMVISPRPDRGPEASQRTSLAIFMKATASCLSAPEVPTKASCPASSANLFGPLLKSRPVSAAISAATVTA